MDNFIRSQVKGSSLEVCCGKSRIGDKTLDIDPAHKPDILADMEGINKFVSPHSFDTVIWDPPFTWYYKLSRFTKTLKKICSIANKRIIMVGSDRFAPGVKGWKRTLYWSAHEANTRIRFIWIYERTDNILGEIPA
jgi:hypothetical protein